MDDHALARGADVRREIIPVRLFSARDLRHAGADLHGFPAPADRVAEVLLDVHFIALSLLLIPVLTGEGGSRRDARNRAAHADRDRDGNRDAAGIAARPLDDLA